MRCAGAVLDRFLQRQCHRVRAADLRSIAAGPAILQWLDSTPNLRHVLIMW
jgi:hypothetical protein